MWIHNSCKDAIKKYCRVSLYLQFSLYKLTLNALPYHKKFELATLAVKKDALIKIPEFYENPGENFYNYIYWYNELIENVGYDDPIALKPNLGPRFSSILRPDLSDSFGADAAKLYILRLPKLRADLLDFFGINFTSHAGLPGYPPDTTNKFIYIEGYEGTGVKTNVPIYEYYFRDDSRLIPPCFMSSYFKKTRKLMMAISETYNGILELAEYRIENLGAGAGERITIKIRQHESIVPESFTFGSIPTNFILIDGVYYTENPPVEFLGKGARNRRRSTRRGGSLVYDIDYSL